MESTNPREASRNQQELVHGLKAVKDSITLVLVTRSEEVPGLFAAHFTVTGETPRVITARKEVIAELVSQIGFDTLHEVERRISRIAHDSSITFQ
jgi:hypothetical protein